MNIRFAFFVIVLAIAGCASDVPRDIAETPVQVVLVTQVQQAIAQYEGVSTRWGGEIIAIENQADISRVEILARQLGSSGKPVVDGTPDARFIAEIPGFLDPVDYQSGQRITVSGTIKGLEVRKVGDYAYPYPVVLVQQYYRWPATDPQPYYDPYWDRYPGPWWPYPYRHPYYW